mmetsp:Transcript_72719/g.229075  ORF Transcript_72719/g.229075 Transcript_72719/m.229075 type:complete len:278 (+) Transcript_72719:188-1021(+)|eukprot:CAMPEP_0182852954 /NCGR_PEP_ID=MMETSP0034_2-20130328/437_1 /TAXON_ID=156128 /ORGANISM="Nephroselmis pyriformis, Strain CCMP717" /LENGTH=277 /DNA_ID=CAMNT_0024983699 /DNA_START=203 /DNA_END=1036 /DNA_ORIENTATION=+
MTEPGAASAATGGAHIGFGRINEEAASSHKTLLDDDEDMFLRACMGGGIMVETDYAAEADTLKMPLWKRMQNLQAFEPTYYKGEGDEDGAALERGEGDGAAAEKAARRRSKLLEDLESSSCMGLNRLPRTRGCMSLDAPRPPSSGAADAGGMRRKSRLAADLDQLAVSAAPPIKGLEGVSSFTYARTVPHSNSAPHIDDREAKTFEVNFGGLRRGGGAHGSAGSGLDGGGGDRSVLPLRKGSLDSWSSEGSSLHRRPGGSARADFNALKLTTGRIIE